MSTIMDTLVTNRVPTGHYNATDLNRVGQAMLYVAGRLQECGYFIPISPKTNWTVTDMVNKASGDKIVKELGMLRGAFHHAVFPPLPGGGRPFTAEEANNIEKILVEVAQVVDYVLTYQHQIISGTSYSGGSLRVQQISRGR